MQRTHQGWWVHSQIPQISTSGSTECKHAHKVLAVVSDQESDFFFVATERTIPLRHHLLQHPSSCSL